MRVAIHAVGRMKNGPERDLVARYADRFAKAGPAVGLEWGGITEAAESRAQTAEQRKRDEGRTLAEALQAGASLVLLDETGKAPTSRQFADMLARQRDSGTRQMVLAIGGADGHDPDLKSRATHVIAFGPTTWPHQIVRIMLAEQLYRAVTILSGHPYHRD